MAEQHGKALVPEIRFSGFTDPWEQRKLGEFDIKTGPFGSTLHAEDYVACGTPIVTTEHFKEGELPSMGNGIPQVGDRDAARLNQYKLQKHDIVFSRVGSVDLNAEVKDAQVGWLFSGRVLRLRTDRGINSTYLHYELGTVRVRSSIIERAVGLTMASINTRILGDTAFFVPATITEQRRIGAFIDRLDSLITLHQRKYDKLCVLKKSMLDKMFPKGGSLYPEIRFSGFTDPWEQRKFGDGMDLLTGFPFESGKFSDNGINLIRGMNVKRGYLDLSDSLCMKWKSSEGLEKYLLENEDILIQMDGALIGKSYAKIKESQLPALLVQRVTRARATPEVSNSDFMYQTIQRVFLKYIILNKTDSAVPHLSLKDIREFPIRVPNLEEQKKIGEYLSNLDNLITLHQRKLELLRNIKKSMLDKMFV